MKGNFNLGLSNGIGGILAALSIALMEGIEIAGQRKAIERILEDYKRFHYVDNNGAVYWPGIIKFEDYISGQCKIDGRRADVELTNNLSRICWIVNCCTGHV